MNFLSSIFLIVTILIVIFIESRGEEVLEKFYWTPKNDTRDIQWEFLVIGKRVAWSVANVLCSNRDVTRRSNDESMELDNTLSLANTTSKLAVLEEDNLKIWLSRMLSESDYRYDGLWIGGHRTNSGVNWTWIGSDDRQELEITSSPTLGNYPEWYKSDEVEEIEKNCLLFDRVGHDVPILVPSDCQLRKPFVCSRVVKKKVPARIVEGIGVNVDGYRFTVYSVDEDDDEEEIDNLENTSGLRKLNGGGVKWRDARIECRKRGQYLATVLSNEAAIKIASIMLKNRPSMESVWLGGWSRDSTEWTWSPTGFILSSRKSTILQYPPWLAGHPVPASNLDEFQEKRGRCLILDRHLCPDHMSPVFLDLDCEKKRPFVCQDGLPGRSGIGSRQSLVNKSIAVGNKVLEFSADRMTWTEGREYCANNFGRIASILDSKTLSAVLDKMTDLYLDHVWVGGRTEKTSEGWRWFDETGKALSRKGIGVGSSWCLGEDDASWPIAEADTCLNLDREGHGLPLFYGLRCDSARQHVLCSVDNGSRSLPSSGSSEETKQEAKLNKNAEEISELSSVLVARIRGWVSHSRSGMLFVLDDSFSILNAWFAEELKLVAIIIRNLFPLSSEHPMGLLTFSQYPRLVLAMNQTNDCTVQSYLADEMLRKRRMHRNSNSNNRQAVRESTDLIKAATMAYDLVQTSGLQRVAIMFIADGEHTIASEDDERGREAVVEKIKSLRNAGHEALAIITGQKFRTSGSDSDIQALFSDPSNDERNLYSVKSFSQLSELVSTINTTTWKANTDPRCEEPQWIVPKDDELSPHLLQKT